MRLIITLVITLGGVKFEFHTATTMLGERDHTSRWLEKPAIFLWRVAVLETLDGTWIESHRGPRLNAPLTEG